jgi:hypothetical protein
LIISATFYRESEKYFIFLIHDPGVKPEKQALMGVYRESEKYFIF